MGEKLGKWIQFQSHKLWNLQIYLNFEETASILGPVTFMLPDISRKHFFFFGNIVLNLFIQLATEVE